MRIVANPEKNKSAYHSGDSLLRETGDSEQYFVFRASFLPSVSLSGGISGCEGDKNNNLFQNYSMHWNLFKLMIL